MANFVRRRPAPRDSPENNNERLFSTLVGAAGVEKPGFGGKSKIQL
jgi:hypothetical protein